MTITVTKPVCNLAPRAVPRTVCNPVPKTTCTDVTDVVIDNVCKTRSVQECVSVPVQTAVVTPVEECHRWGATRYNIGAVARQWWLSVVERMMTRNHADW